MSPQVALEPANPGDLVRPGSPKVKMQFGPTGTFLPRLAGAFAPLPRAQWRTRLCRMSRWHGKVLEPEVKEEKKSVDYVRYSLGTYH